ncbi:hypothetical protein M231_00879 [Tremella mesenterica]|uniref:Uncharacterized protein n=1 Tax=Tremella mesenterica TaxID=5217 RepID=A0A4Q1BV05_TREME|nr:hypothetical protein M231_00879 [Tremella mesenterica]
MKDSVEEPRCPLGYGEGSRPRAVATPSRASQFTKQNLLFALGGILAAGGIALVSIGPENPQVSHTSTRTDISQSIIEYPNSTFASPPDWRMDKNAIWGSCGQ